MYSKYWQMYRLKVDIKNIFFEILTLYTGVEKWKHKYLT
jgi:hypothetical protein